MEKVTALPRICEEKHTRVRIMEKGRQGAVCRALPRPHLEQQQEQSQVSLMHGPDDLKEQVDEGHVVTLREGTILMLALAHRH